MITVTQTRIELKPFHIGDILIDPPLLLAPMAGHTLYPFRALCREVGDCGLVCTELISSQAMQHKKGLERTRLLFDWREHEHPFAVQLFGSDPRVMAEAARIVVAEGADIVDINMGCWVPKIAKKGGAGAALLKDVDKAAAVVEAVVNAVAAPVTVKIRNGWTCDNPTAVPFAQAAEQVGVKMIAVHGRFAEQGFQGEADWSYIRQVKEAVKNIPVIGNGDVLDAADASRMMEETGCDGVMIGRAALGNPWIFRQIVHEIRTGAPLPPPTHEERAATMMKHARLTVEVSPHKPHRVFRELRGQLMNYTTGMPGASQIRTAIARIESMDDLEAALAPFLES